MELYRRAASGRLSELLGDATIAVDRRFRVLGLREAAQAEWDHTPSAIRTAFDAHAAGVNAAMSVSALKLPIEHQLLRYTPEPWTPIDSLAISKLFAWRLGENHRAELLRYTLQAALGARALELFPSPPTWAPVTLEGSGLRAEGLGGSAGIRDQGLGIRNTGIRDRGLGVRRASAYPEGLGWLFDGHALSNGWVVHGSRTKSGRPILANDPHLNVEMPSVWWEVHVVSDTLNVAGVTIPGIPFVIIGHNERVGWGLTNVGTDVQDFFIEKLDASRKQYLAGDRWVPLDVKQHEIRVRGRHEPVRVEVRSTRHGPLLDADDWQELQPGDPVDETPLGDTALSLKWSVINQPGSAAAFDALARAGNWTQFVAAVRRFAAPAQNFLYIDADGNIGYATSGLVPSRAGSDGSVPTPGWPEDAGWRGYVDMAQLPAVLNPASGQVVTSNNEVSRSLPFVLTRDWVAPFRAQRIVELLGDRRDLDFAAMRQIQADITSRSADWILSAITIPDQLHEMRTWNRRVDERRESLLFEAFEEALWRLTFADEMPPELYERFYRHAGNERFAGLHAVITDPQSSWFDDVSTPAAKESREDIVRQAADAALVTLRARFGSQPVRWDEVHAVTFAHALAGGGRILDWFFSRGPVPVMGNSMTVNKTTTNLRRPYVTSEAASYRQILDAGAWDDSVAINTTGQSGHPRSPHYFDQNPLWRQVQHRPLPFTREAVDSATVSQMQLVP